MAVRGFIIMRVRVIIFIYLFIKCYEFTTWSWPAVMHSESFTILHISERWWEHSMQRFSLFKRHEQKKIRFNEINKQTEKNRFVIDALSNECTLIYSLGRTWSCSIIYEIGKKKITKISSFSDAHAILGPDWQRARISINLMWKVNLDRASKKKKKKIVNDVHFVFVFCYVRRYAK